MIKYLLFILCITNSLLHAVNFTGYRQLSDHTENNNYVAYIAPPPHVQTHTNYLLHDANPGANIRDLILNTIQDSLFVLDGNFGDAIPHRDMPNHVEINDYSSGGLDGENLFIFGTEANAIIDTFSRRHIDSIHGQFVIQNGHRLAHTEPKALNTLLEIINGGSNIRSALLITERPMCPFCTDLCLRIIHRNATLNTNIIIISLDQLARWINGNNDLLIYANQNLLQRIENYITAPHQGNRLVLLTKYQ